MKIPNSSKTTAQHRIEDGVSYRTHLKCRLENLAKELHDCGVEMFAFGMTLPAEAFWMFSESVKHINKSVPKKAVRPAEQSSGYDKPFNAKEFGSIRFKINSVKSKSK